MKYFDIHSHLHSDFFKGNIEKVLEEMKKKEIGTISVGVNLIDSKKAVDLANKNKNIWATIGIHPTEKEKFEEEKFQKLVNQNKNKIIGIGECGLDYYWLQKDLEGGKIKIESLTLEKERQKELFKKQIDFAIKNNLPLMLHVRPYKNADAYWDVFEILDKKREGFSSLLKVNFHFFTEKPEIAQEILKRGYYISLPGVITFADLDKTIENIPLEKIMPETDSPFAAPIPHRGKINTPLFVPEIFKKIAKIKNISEEKCHKQLSINIGKFWNIKF